MFNANSASDAIIEQIKQDSGAWSPEQLQALLEAGRRTRAPDFDSTVKGIAVRYAGDQQSVVRSALTKAYPRTGDKMPIDPVNWLRFFARQDCGVYQMPAKRELVDEEGVPLDVENERAKSFNDALSQIGIDVVMPECERRAATGARSVVVVVGFRRIGENDTGKAVAHIYWPHDVVTLAHPSAPDDPSALWFVALRQSGDRTAGAADVWWVWSREWTEDEAGTLVSFGKWSHRRVSEDTSKASASEVYEGRLPVAFLRTESTAGGFWPDPDRDILSNVDSLNVSRSNRQHVINLQAHSQLIYSGTMRETKELVVGPDAAVQIGSGEAIQYLTPSADHAAIEASASRDLSELGVARGNSPDAYSVEPGAPQSGVSRIIANAPHDQRIAEQRPIFVDFEQEQLLPIVLDVLALFSPTAPASFDGCYPVVTLGASKAYEDDAAKTQRVLDLKTAGIIDEADARVMLGLSADRTAALAYLEQKRATQAPADRLARVGVSGSPFSALRETSVTSGRNE